jgi:diphthamide biosynthesis enzyme Dph1/Dph2-like protein
MEAMHYALQVEKARNANIVGILVGTLGVAGYLQAIDRLRDLIHQCTLP